MIVTAGIADPGYNALHLSFPHVLECSKKTAPQFTSSEGSI